MGGRAPLSPAFGGNCPSSHVHSPRQAWLSFWLRNWSPGCVPGSPRALTPPGLAVVAPAPPEPVLSFWNEILLGNSLPLLLMKERRTASRRSLLASLPGPPGSPPAGGLHSLQGEGTLRPIGGWAESRMGSMASLSSLLGCGAQGSSVALRPQIRIPEAACQPHVHPLPCANGRRLPCVPV